MPPPSEFARLTVLTVTHDTTLASRIAAALNVSPAPELIAVADLDEAVHAVARGADAVLLDAALIPDDGALKAFKARVGTVPVIVLLEQCDSPARWGALEREANAVVCWDRLEDDLHDTLSRAVVRRALVRGVAGRIARSAHEAAPVGEAAFGPMSDVQQVAAQSSLTVERLSPGFDLGQPHPARPGEARTFLRGLSLTSAVPANGGACVVRTACALNCGSHFCGLAVTVREGHAVKVEAADFPDERYRRICLKGISQVQMAAHPDRLRTPLRRVGPRGSGSFEPVSWDAALDGIAARMAALAAEHGPESLMFLSYSGQLGALHGVNGVYLRLASALGASATDPVSFGVDTAVPSGLEDTFGQGAGYVANDYADLVNSRLVLIWGTNPVYSRMNWWRFFADAQSGGTRLVTIDPRFTATASKSDDWLPVRPGTDLYLALAMLREIVTHGWIDRAFVTRHTVAPLLVRLDDGRYLRDGDGGFVVWDEAAGRASDPERAESPALHGVVTVDGVACRPAYDLLCEMAAPYTLDLAAARTGLPPHRIADLARTYATSRPARIYTLYGIDRWHHGATFGRLIGTLAALTGNVGIPGGGAGVDGFCDFPLFASSFPTPDGTRFVPVNPVALPAQILCEQPNPIRMVWVAFSNWLNQWPDQARLRSEILPKLDLLVVSEMFMTETARWADYVLPVTTLFEREDIVNGPTPYVQYQPAFLTPPPECRSDFEIVRAIAQRLGVGDYFAAEPADYLADILAETPGFTADSFADLRREGVLRRSPAVVQRVAHADRRFATPTGRVEFYVERLLPYGRALPDYEPPAEACSEGALREQFPLVCITEHSLYRVHSTFVNAPWLREMDAEPVALLHPSEGAARGVADRDIVRVFNERGYVVLRAHLDEAVPAGTVYFTQGWQTDDFLAGHPQTLTHGRTNPANAFGPNSSFSDVLVQVVKEEG